MDVYSEYIKMMYKINMQYNITAHFTIHCSKKGTWKLYLDINSSIYM